MAVMAMWMTCEQCRRRLRVKGAVSNNTLKCSYCGHLQYASEPSEHSVAAWQAGGGTATKAAPARPTDGLGLSAPSLEQLFGEKPPDAELDLFGKAAAPALSTQHSESSEKTLPSGGWTDYFYWLLILTLVPLGLSCFLPKDSVKERFERTERSNPRIVERWKEQQHPTLDGLVSSFPGERIEGAFLPRSSQLHWGFASISAIGSMILIMAIFPRRASSGLDLGLIGLFTGTIGIFLLLTVQFLAAITQGIWIHGTGTFTLIFYILKFIGYSYRSALSPNSNFVLSFLGFTFGVGLCEELCKAMPLIWYYRHCDSLSWRGACRWGLATGAGFGIAEGISYSADFYNGLSTADAYIVRFVSCVGLHAVWSACVAISLYKNQEQIQGDMRWHQMALPLLRVLAVPMVLHGLYDTLLKMSLHEMALVTAVVSFAWLAWQIESLREQEAKAQEPVTA
jgi:RsiW-degrading membrane proteinase PrsW (M82 family)